MKKTLALFLIIFLVSCNDNTLEISTNSSPNENGSFMEENEDKTTLHNVFYKAFMYEENEVLRKQVLKITQKEIVENDALFSHSEMEISAVGNKWTNKVKAHQLDIKNNTLEAKYNADYEHEDTYSLYNIETGKHLLDYTYGCLTAKIPASNFKRYMGFVAKTNATGLLDKMDDDVLGIITYASDAETKQQFLLKTTKDINTTTPSMALVSINENQQLFENDRLLFFMDLASDFKASDINFAFGFTFYQGETAEETALLFEVKEDKINLKDAKYDKQVFEIEAL